MASDLAQRLFLLSLLARGATSLTVTQRTPPPFRYDPAHSETLNRSVTHGFALVVLKGALYVSREVAEIETRATSTIHGLLHLSLTHRLPDVVVSFVTAADGMQGGEPRPGDLPLFDFFRGRGRTWPLLWPDHDFFGWPTAFVAPFSALAREMVGEQPAWHDRSETLF